MDSSEIKLLRALAIFLRERSVSRAGEVLHLSQPAASHILTRLRKLFGDPLLLRSRNGMVATERALAIGPAVARMLAEYFGDLLRMRTISLIRICSGMRRGSTGSARARPARPSELDKLVTK